MSVPVEEEIQRRVAEAMGEPYGYGTACTWHGPLTFASLAPKDDPGDEDAYVCPHCALPLQITTDAAFWLLVRARSRNPDAEAILRWSEGKCFADADTLENAWRQAMEGQW